MADPALLDQYKLAVEMADRVSARRAGANSFFLTANTALAATVGIVGASTRPPPDAFGVILTCVAGLILAGVWGMLLRYYRRLNGAKFHVINEMEKQLPAQPFTDEWNYLKADGRKHREATIVEQVVPVVFMLLFVAAGIQAGVR